MIKNKICIQLLTILLLTGTLFGKEAPREFSFSTLTSNFDTQLGFSQSLTKKELIKPVLLDSSCDFKMPLIFQYFWIEVL